MEKDNTSNPAVQSTALPAVYLIFTLAQAVRRGIPRKNIWREFRRQHIASQPRLIFWVTLCKQLGILKIVKSELRLTSYAHAWLNKKTDQQTIDLIEAWQNAPKNIKARQFRKKLLWKLKYNKPLTHKDKNATQGLDALGLTKDNALNQWGKIFIQNDGKLPTTPPHTQPCWLNQTTFNAPLHLHIDLLWRLETHLRPSRPGQYPLNKRTLRNSDPQTLITLLEEGLQHQLPEHIKALILGQPSIKVSEGIVLEFSSPAEMAQLRRQPVLRKYIQEFLSPQTVLVSKQDEKALYKLLHRRGAHLQQHEDLPPVQKKKRTHFYQKTILQPVGKSVSKLILIEKYKQLQQALDIVYRTPGYNPEQRRITPLAIEQRGEHTYIIAHCQTRRGQRTFRLDRMEIPGTW